MLGDHESLMERESELPQGRPGVLKLFVRTFHGLEMVNAYCCLGIRILQVLCMRVFPSHESLDLG